MLAIIIPYYKITFFEETLESLANQTDKRFKVYIGNDNSPENPLHLLEKYNNKFEFEYIKFSTNIGGKSLVKQWERCIDLVEDEQWLMILGDDDVLDKDVVKKWHLNFELFLGKSNLIRFSTQIIDYKGKVNSKCFRHPKFENSEESFFKRFKGLTRSSLSEYIFLKEIYMKYKFKNYPLAWHSDDYAWLDFAEKKPIYTINDSSVFIRVSQESISGNINNIDLKGDADILFLKDVILEKIQRFKKKQIIDLLYGYEVSIKNNRSLFFKEWIRLLSLYLKFFRIKPIIKFFRRFFISFFKL